MKKLSYKLEVYIGGGTKVVYDSSDIEILLEVINWFYEKTTPSFKFRYADSNMSVLVRSAIKLIDLTRS